MLSPYILAALARERHQTLLARAETSRRDRQARLHRQQAGRRAAQHALAVPMSDAVYAMLQPWAIRNQRASA